MNKWVLLIGAWAMAWPAGAAERYGPPVPGVTAPVSGSVLAGDTIPAEPIGAALAAGPELNLIQCIEEALLRNPDLGIAESAIEAARGRRETANGALGPTVEAGYSEVWQQQNKVTLSPGAPAVTVTPGNVRQFTLGSTWVLFSGGALRANQAIARLSEAAAGHQRTAAVNSVISQTVAAYLNLLRAEELKAVADETVRLAGEQVKVATINFEAGTVPRVNVLRAEAALQNALQAQLSAGNAIALASAALNKQMGRSQLLPVKVAKLNINLAGTPDLLESLKLAVLQRPELRAQQKAIDINEQAVRAAQAGYLPTVAVNSQYSHTPSVGAFGSADDFRVALSVNLTLWDWFSTRGEVRTARAQVERERRSLERAVQEIELQVRQSVLRIDEARQRVSVAEAEVAAARGAHEIEMLRYTTGDGTFLELLDARRALSESQANLVTALYDYALAEADWLAATGGYVAGGETVRLPQNQSLPMPAASRARGVDYDDLLERFQSRPPADGPAPDQQGR